MLLLWWVLVWVTVSLHLIYDRHRWDTTTLIFGGGNVFSLLIPAVLFTNLRMVHSTLLVWILGGSYLFLTCLGSLLNLQFIHLFNSHLFFEILIRWTLHSMRLLQIIWLSSRKMPWVWRDVDYFSGYYRRPRPSGLNRNYCFLRNLLLRGHHLFLTLILLNYFQVLILNMICFNFGTLSRWTLTVNVFVGLYCNLLIVVKVLMSVCSGSALRTMNLLVLISCFVWWADKVVLLLRVLFVPCLLVVDWRSCVINDILGAHMTWLQFILGDTICIGH